MVYYRVTYRCDKIFSGESPILLVYTNKSRKGGSCDELPRVGLLNNCHDDFLKTFMRCIFSGYLGDLCAVHKDDRPSIIRILERVCAVSDVQTCEEVHIDATNFSVNPSFACRVVVSIVRLIHTLSSNV